MKSLWAAFWAESLKVRKSKMFGVTVSAFAFIAFMMGCLIFIAKHPELAGKSALLNAKASIFAQVDWPSYFGLLNQFVALMGMIGFGFVTSWVFGREYSDRAVKDLLALPVSRATIVTAKLIIAGIWCLILAVVLFGAGLAAGWMVKLSGWPGSKAVFQEIRLFAGTAFLTILLGGPVAFMASWGRGYLAPMGYLILAMIVTQFVVAALPGLGAYLPWAVPALFSGAAGPGSHPGLVSYLILFGTSLLGCAATFAWWQHADQH